MMANNEVGTIQPIKELCQIAHEMGALFHTDAVQAVGHIKFDVHELGVDLLSASAHKFNGPKGVGFLYIKKGTKIYPLNDGGAQEFGLRGGTENVAGVVGMATALKYNIENINTNISKLKTLEEIIINKLTEAKIDFIRNGSNNRIPGNISLSFKNSEGEMLLHRLDLMGICVSTGSACDSKNTQISHVLKAMQIPKEYAKGTIRISLGHNNTESESKTIAEALIKILR
jgi:cysteine desulfurase